MERKVDEHPSKRRMAGSLCWHVRESPRNFRPDPLSEPRERCSAAITNEMHNGWIDPSHPPEKEGSCHAFRGVDDDRALGDLRDCEIQALDVIGIAREASAEVGKQSREEKTRKVPPADHRSLESRKFIGVHRIPSTERRLADGLPKGTIPKR